MIERTPDQLAAEDTARRWAAMEEWERAAERARAEAIDTDWTALPMREAPPEWDLLDRLIWAIIWGMAGGLIACAVILPWRYL